VILTSASSRLTPNPTPATGRNFSHGNPGRATKRGAAHQNTTVVGPTSQPATPQNKPLRLRNRDHLKFVSAQACLALVGAGQMHTISGLRSSARLGAKSVMNSRCRFAGLTIVSSTGAAVNADGGSISMSIQCPWRNGCGEHLNAARLLQLHLQYRLIYDREPGQGRCTHHASGKSGNDAL
jgi:hypothetical protein